MTHLIIYPKGSNQIQYFIKDCIKNNNSFEGSNKSVFGVKLNLFDYKWTNDLIIETSTGFSKNVDQVITVSSSDNTHVIKPSRETYRKSVKVLENINNFSSDLIAKRMENINDLASAKLEIKEIAKVLTSLCNYVFYKVK